MSDTPVFGLTAVMRDALLVIQELIAIDGRSPSYADIRREMCLASVSRVHKIILGLCDRGYLAKLPYRVRSLVVLRPIPFPEEPEIVGFFDTASP
jgi:SOS-response transcriptional repressor LexA